MFSKELEWTLHSALKFAKDDSSNIARLEHLLLALLNDEDAREVLEACGVILDDFERELQNGKELYENVQLPDGLSDENVQLSQSFQRVLQRAAIHVQASNYKEVNGSSVLISLFSERESFAVRLLKKWGVTRYDAVNYISHGISKGDDSEFNSPNKKDYYTPPNRLISMETILQVGNEHLILESVFISPDERMKNKAADLNGIAKYLGASLELYDSSMELNDFIIKEFSNQLSSLTVGYEDNRLLFIENALHEIERYACVVQVNPIMGLSLHDIKTDISCGAQLGVLGIASGDSWLIYAAAAGIVVIRITKPIFTGAVAGANVAAKSEAEKRGLFAGIAAFFCGPK